MQISGSYASYSASTSGKSSTSSSSSQNTIFQNLLQDSAVQDNVTENADGSYTWTDNTDGSAGGYHEWLAKQLIAEQNSTDTATTSTGQAKTFTDSDTAKFRQLTGYNLVQTGDLTYIVDDNGNAPPASAANSLNAAWAAFDNAKGEQSLEGSGSDLSYQEIEEALKGVKGGLSKQSSDTSGVDAIMAAIDKLQANSDSNAA